MMQKEDTIIDSNLLGPCGVYCGYCLAYKKKLCSGCRYEADKQTQRGKTEWCTLLNCAKERQMKECSDCDDFPCKEYDPDGKGMYSRMYIRYINEEIKPVEKRP
jgi:hypothetical protein